MGITWAEVVDDAIKIGLGGLTTAGFGYLVLKSNQRQEHLKERQTRIREEFRIIEQHLVQTRHALQSQFDACETYLANRKRKLPAERLAEVEEHLVNAVKGVQHINYDTTLIDTKLMLMGYSDIAKSCRDFHWAISRFYELVVNDRKNAPDKEFEETISRLVETRDDLCLRLGQVHGELFTVEQPSGAWARHPIRALRRWWNS